MTVIKTIEDEARIKNINDIELINKINYAIKNNSIIDFIYKNYIDKIECLEEDIANLNEQLQELETKNTLLDDENTRLKIVESKLKSLKELL